MMSAANRQKHFDDKSYGYGAKCREYMRIAAARFDNFPLHEAGFGAGAAMLPGGVLFAAGHGGFVSRDDFVGVALLANMAVVDPEDALAEATNLVELVGDEDDGVAGVGDVAH